MILAGLSLTPGTGTPQITRPDREVVIPDRVECRGCDLVFDTIHVLGLVPGSELFEWPGASAVRDRTGKLWLTNGQFIGTFLVFDADGRSELFARPGDGPGEFNSIAHATCDARGDIVFLSRPFIYTIDTEARVVTRGASAAYGPMGSFSTVLVSDTTAWIAAPPRDARHLGFPIVEYDLRSGSVIGAWGKSVEQYDRMVERHANRILARFPGARIAASHVYDYVIDVYARDGRLLSRYVRDAPWFRPQLSVHVEAFLVVALPLDERYLMTAVWVRPPGWTPPAPETAPEAGGFSGQFDAVVEVLDLVQHRVVYRRRLDDPPISIVCPTGELVLAGRDGLLEKLTVVRARFKEGT